MPRKIHKLTEKKHLDFTLIGIASSENDYRLSWILNNTFELQLSKTSNLEVFETLAYDETYQYSWTALTKTRNSRAGWNGLFQMAFKINS